MTVKRQLARARGRWIYAYELNPPQPEPRFRRMRELLRRAQLAARRAGRLWTGRIVLETKITHILVVTDHANQVRHVDRAIERELKRLHLGFALTGPARFAMPLAKTDGKGRVKPKSRAT